MYVQAGYQDTRGPELVSIETALDKTRVPGYQGTQGSPHTRGQELVSIVELLWIENARYPVISHKKTNPWSTWVPGNRAV
eukprot:920718-Rhodomonas_salina.1